MGGNKVYRWKKHMQGLIFLPVLVFYLALAMYVL
jgi:hypothetical protein